MSIQIDTRRFGRIEVADDQVLSFDEGLVGFPNLRRFVRIARDGLEPIEFLVSLDEPRFAFPVLSPLVVCPDYDFSLSDNDREALQLGEDTAALVITVAHLARQPEDSSVNLRAPILINLDNRKGRQVILEESTYDIVAPMMARESVPRPG